MIRQFNRATPIVAVTSNIKPSHVMSYFAAGMNDVLGTPFTKVEVIELLEKHLAHLKSTPTRTSSQSSIQSSGFPSNLPLKRPWEETAATVGDHALEKRGRY